MQNLMIASCLVVAGSAYDYSGPGLATWPSSGFFTGSTVYGAHGYRIGKRSADASIGYGIGYGIALPTTLENRNNVHGHELASGYAISQPHPGAAGSFQQRTQLHSGYGKRSADASYGYGIGYGIALPTTLENRNNVHGHELASGYAISQPHPGAAGSFQQRTQLHSGYGKRSADASYGYGIGYGIALPTTLENRNNVHGHELASGYAISQPHPGAAGSFQQRTQLHSGYGKRSADADASYGAVATLENRNNVHGHEYASQYAISQPHPGFGGSYQQVSRLHSGLHYGGYYGKRSAEPFSGYGGVAVHPGRAVSSTQRSAQGLSVGYGYGHGFYGYGKRSADAYYGAATSAYAVNQAHPGYAGSYQQVSRLHSGIGYGYGGYLY